VDRTIRCEISKRIKFIWDKEGLPEEWKEFLLIVLIYKKGDNRDCNNFRGIQLCQLRTKLYPTSCCQGLLHMQGILLGIIGVDFDAKGQLLIILSTFATYLKKKWEYKQAVHQLFIDFKKAYGSVSREDLYNILIQFGIPMKLYG
jgi:hypothetical protein